MINLLPPKYRQKLREEERFRLVLLLGIILGIALLALSVFLLVVQVSLAKERLSQEFKLSFLEQKSIKEGSILTEIKNQNSKLSNINSFKQGRRSLKDVFDEVGFALPQDLHLLSFSYTPVFEIKKKGGETQRTLATVSVTGKAQTREQLLLFKDALQANLFFAEVVFPPSNWVSPSDITFSFQAKLKDLP